MLASLGKDDYSVKVSSQTKEIQDCPGHSRTVGAYETAMAPTSEVERLCDSGVSLL